MRTDRPLAAPMAALVGILLLAASASAFAAEESGAAPVDREKAALAVEEDLMCHCGCTDLTVRVCNCGVAAEIKADIRSRLKEGQTPAEVEAAYVARYGEQIRSAPTRTGFNLLAWTMPFAVILAAGGVIAVLVRRWGRAHAAAEAAAPPAAKPDRAALERVDRAMRDLL
jgi:cytochrome c-type biogenesis protein CcmH